jgi:hypothetical protein
MRRDEARQEVAQLRGLRLVARRIVRHRLCAADLVDADYERLQIPIPRLRCEIQDQEAHGEKRDENESDLEVRVQQQR